VTTIRVALLFFCLALSAQTPEQPDAVKQARDAYNAFASAANEWATKHNELIASREDSERLKKALKAFEKFRRLAKEAQLLAPQRKTK